MADFKLVGPYQHIEIAPDSQVDLGTDVTLRSFVSLEVGSGARLKLGNRVFFNDHCTLRCAESIEIGKDTMFGDGVRIFDHNHDYSNYHIEKIAFKTAPIHIGKNCWIGTNSVILAGVTIGDNVIVGAGTVVHKDVPANSIVVSREDWIVKDRLQHQHHVFSLTASDTLENLAYLVEQLPDVAFHIAAKTNVSDYLQSFKRYDNVTIYSNVHHEDIIEDLLERAVIYLDINHWGEVDHIVERAVERGKPVLAFDNVVHRPDLAQVFSAHQPETMVDRIREIVGENSNA